MNKIKIKQLKTLLCILSAFALSLMSSCKDKDKDQPEPITEVPLEMPPFTDTGANMFAFKVDGKVVVAQNSTDNGVKPIFAIYLASSNTNKALEIEGRYIKDDYYESAVIRMFLDSPGVYEISNPNIAGQGVYHIGTDNLTHSYVTNYDKIGQIIITKIDTEKKIIAGKFNFSGRDLFGSDTSIKKITEGQFDVIYYE